MGFGFGRARSFFTSPTVEAHVWMKMVVGRDGGDVGGTNSYSHFLVMVKEVLIEMVYGDRGTKSNGLW